MASADRLIDILRGCEAITPADLERAVHLHEEQGGSFAELLVREGLINEDDLFFLMARQLGVPAIPAERLLHLALSPELRLRVPSSLARECVLVPLDLDAVHGRLSVAMLDPSDHLALDRLQRASRVQEIRAYLGRRSAVLDAIEAVYTAEDDARAAQRRGDLPLLSGEAAEDTDEKWQEEAARAVQRGSVELDPALALEIEAYAEGLYDPPSDEPTRLQREEQVMRPQRPQVPQVSQVSQVPRLRHGRSLLRDEPAEPIGVPAPRGRSAVTQEFEDAETPEPYAVSEREEVTQVRPSPRARGSAALSPSQAGLAALSQAADRDGLLPELLASVGILASMLEERIDPEGGHYQQYGQLSRLVARELGLDELAVARVALAAHLYGLDLALKREVGTAASLKVQDVFCATPRAPGGLGPSLRMLGAKCLGLTEGSDVEPIGARLVRLVTDYLELRAESAESSSDFETVVQLLRTGGGEALLVEALSRAVSTLERPRVRVGRGSVPNTEE